MGRVMRAVQHVLMCYVSCVRLAPPPHTRMPLVGPTSAPARKGRCGSPRCSEEGPAKAVPAAVATAAATTTGSEPEVLFPRLTDDGYSFYDDRYVSSGGSEAWLQNLKGTLSSQVLQRVGAHLAVTTGIAVAVALAFGCAREGLLPEAITLSLTLTLTLALALTLALTLTLTLALTLILTLTLTLTLIKALMGMDEFLLQYMQMKYGLEHLGQLEVLDAVVVPHLVGDEPRDEDEPGQG